MSDSPKSALGSNLAMGAGMILVTGVIVCIFNFKPSGTDESALNKQVIEAKQLLAQKDYVGAEHLLRDLTRVAPTRADIRCLLAESLYKQKRLSESLSELKSANERDPQNSETKEAMSAIKEQMQETKATSEP